MNAAELERWSAEIAATTGIGIGECRRDPERGITYEVAGFVQHNDGATARLYYVLHGQRIGRFAPVDLVSDWPRFDATTGPEAAP